MKLVNFRADEITLAMLEKLCELVDDSKSGIVRVAIRGLAKEVLTDDQINQVYQEVYQKELEIQNKQKKGKSGI